MPRAALVLYRSRLMVMLDQLRRSMAQIDAYADVVDSNDNEVFVTDGDEIVVYEHVDGSIGQPVRRLPASLSEAAAAVLAGANVCTLVDAAFASRTSVAAVVAQLAEAVPWLDVQAGAKTATHAVRRSRVLAERFSLLSEAAPEFSEIAAHTARLHESLTSLAKAGVLANETPELRESVADRLGALEVAYVQCSQATR